MADPVAFSRAHLQVMAPSAVAKIAESLDAPDVRVSLRAASLVLDGVMPEVTPKPSPEQDPDLGYLRSLAELQKRRDERDVALPPRMRENAILAPWKPLQLTAGEPLPPIETWSDLPDLLTQLQEQRRLAPAFAKLFETPVRNVLEVSRIVASEDGKWFAEKIPGRRTPRVWAPHAWVRDHAGLSALLLLVSGTQHRCPRAHHGTCPRTEDADRDLPPCRFWQMRLAEVVLDRVAAGTFPQCATDYDLMRLQLFAWHNRGSNRRVVPVVVLGADIDQMQARRWQQRVALWNGIVRDVDMRVRLTRVSDLIGVAGDSAQG